MSWIHPSGRNTRPKERFGDTYGWEVDQAGTCRMDMQNILVISAVWKHVFHIIIIIIIIIFNIILLVWEYSWKSENMKLKAYAWHIMNAQLWKCAKIRDTFVMDWMGGTLSCSIWHRGIQQGSFVVFFWTWLHQGFHPGSISGRNSTYIWGKKASQTGRGKTEEENWSPWQQGREKPHIFNMWTSIEGLKVRRKTERNLAAALDRIGFLIKVNSTNTLSSKWSSLWRVWHFV